MGHLNSVPAQLTSTKIQECYSAGPASFDQHQLEQGKGGCTWNRGEEEKEEMGLRRKGDSFSSVSSFELPIHSQLH